MKKTAKTYYSIQQFYEDVADVAEEIDKDPRLDRLVYVYGVPQGGTVFATALAAVSKIGLLQIDEEQLTNKPAETVLVVDDVIDSGTTRRKYADYTFIALHMKPWSGFVPSQAGTRAVHTSEDWIVYWWEGQQERSIRDSVVRQLQFIHEDPEREGLKETPERVIRSWDILYGGYQQSPEDVIKVFEDDNSDEMVLLKDVEFYSTCEHHMLPFFGKAHIAYLPNNRVVGISKLARLLEVYARRLQIQERLGDQVTSALMKHLMPLGAACVLEAQHFCMTARGVQKQNSIMVTSSLKGVFRKDARARSEFMGLIK